MMDADYFLTIIVKLRFQHGVENLDLVKLFNGTVLNFYRINKCNVKLIY